MYLGNEARLANVEQLCDVVIKAFKAYDSRKSKWLGVIDLSYVKWLEICLKEYPL